MKNTIGAENNKLLLEANYFMFYTLQGSSSGVNPMYKRIAARSLEDALTVAKELVNMETIVYG